ncbi:ATP-binding cassette, subfamily G (WHITE), member 2 [Marchantia polymorpha subsp. ruderalis]
MQFEDVRYSVQNYVKTSGRLPQINSTVSEEKVILHGLSGMMLPGKITALLGPSGSGKTTLLLLLGGRDLNYKGSITYNGSPLNSLVKRRIGFVTQEDILYPYLTVHETLLFAALMKLPKSMSREAKMQRVQEVITELDLERCKGTIVGGPLKKSISGGEKKRVCIGEEMLTKPSILLLDEPTSGLDSTTALRVMRMLKRFAKEGHTVVTSIHQPSSIQFYHLDQILLFSTGQLIYSGEAREAVSYFASLGLSPNLVMNPAEFLLDLAHGSTLDVQMQSQNLRKTTNIQGHMDGDEDLQNSNELLQFLNGSYEALISIKEKCKLLKMSDSGGEILNGEETTDKQQTWWSQFVILLWRIFKERKLEFLSYIRLLQTLAVAFVVSVLWWDSNTDSQRDREDQQGLIFVITLFWASIPLSTAVLTFCQERTMLIKEKNSNTYRLSAYFMSRSIGDLPLDYFLATVFLIVVYFMTHLKMTAASFLLTVFGTYLSIMAAQSLGYLIGASFIDVKKATATGSTLLIVSILTGGYYVVQVPAWIKWMKYLSFNYYAYNLLVKIQYDPCLLTWNEGGFEVCLLIVIIVLYRVLAYFALKYIALKL